jgi:peptidoglycan/LPS O-acetylase OafA/YrhL
MKKYYKQIDGLRFVAITLVLIEHFAHFIGSKVSAGYFGVDLFFVISGFLITKTLLKPNEYLMLHNFRNFIGRRMLRIFPIYYLTLVTLLIVGVDSIRENVIYLFTYTYNLIQENGISPVSHFWSLAVEEQFYIFWPIIVLLLKNKHKALIIICHLLIIVGYAQMVFHFMPKSPLFSNASLFTRIASLSLGALGAVYSDKYLLSKTFFNSMIIELGVILILLIALTSENSFKYPILGLSSLYLVLKSAHFGFKTKIIDRFLENKHIISIGTVSYGIYVYHFPIGIFLSKYFIDPLWINLDFEQLGKFKIIRWHSWILKLPLYSILSILLAWCSFKFIEKPLLNLKDKYFN